MRRAVVLVALAMAAPHGARAHTEEHPVEFFAPVPCTVACPYWVGSEQSACDKEAIPRQSYDEIITEPAPEPPVGKRILLVFHIFPVIDYDSFICSYPGYGLLRQGTGPIGENCDNFLGPDNPIPIGCREREQTAAEAGKQYVLRAWNWSDALPCPGSYRWVFV